MSDENQTLKLRSELEKALSRHLDESENRFLSIRAAMGQMLAMEKGHAFFVTLPACNSET